MKCNIMLAWHFGYELFAVNFTDDKFTKIFRPQQRENGVYWIGEDFDPFAPGIKPSIFMTKEMLKCLVDEAHTHDYVKPESVSLVEGKYDAQSKHLDDLRHLLKLPKAKETEQ